jgi:stress-induced morphogen
MGGMAQYDKHGSSSEEATLPPFGSQVMRVEDLIREKLSQAFAPMELEVVNDSASHAGHAASPGSGESHFSVMVVSGHFSGKSRIDRHRMVNSVLAHELDGPVHALVITALTPEERSARS